MTTVYIVTDGSYSDYHICRVFLDRDKAEDYAKTKPDSQIEEWEADDDKELGLFKTVTATLEIKPSGYRNFEMVIRIHTLLDTSIDQVEQSLYFNDLKGTYNPRELLEITRLVPNGISDDQLSKKYEQIIEDIHAQIKILFDVKGWTEPMVDEWLNDQGKWEDGEMKNSNK